MSPSHVEEASVGVYGVHFAFVAPRLLRYRLFYAFGVSQVGASLREDPEKLNVAHDCALRISILL